MEVLLIAFAPILAVFAGYSIFNAICRMRREEQLVERTRVYGGSRERMFDDEYNMWLQMIDEAGELVPMACPIQIEADEQCFAFSHFVTMYESRSPRRRSDLRVGADSVGTTIMDDFDHVRLLDRGSLCVTDRQVVFHGAKADISVPLEDVSAVDAESAGLMLESRRKDGVLLFNGVCGRLFRDTINMLLEKE